MNFEETNINISAKYTNLKKRPVINRCFIMTDIDKYISHHVDIIIKMFFHDRYYMLSRVISHFNALQEWLLNACT